MKPYCFVLLIGTASLHTAFGRWVDDAFGQTKCKNNQFHKNRKELYSYVGIVENGIMGTTANMTRMKITSDVMIVNWNGCDFHLKMVNTKIYESLGSSTVAYKILKSDDLVKRLGNHALRFVMKNGVVTHISPSVKSTRADVLNIQRGILSMLQVRQVKDEQLETVEDDVSGSCQTKYIRHVKNGHGVVDDDVEHIDKIKDMDTCKGHQISHSNIYGDSYNEDETAVPKNPVLKSTSVCSYELHKKKRASIKVVVCKEHFLVQPFSSETDAGAYVSSWAKLSRKSSQRIKKQEIPYTDLYFTSIKYDHNHQHTTKHLPLKEEVKLLLNDLADNDYYESNFDTAGRFFELVISFRHLSSKDIAEIISTVKVEKEAVRFYLFDAMAQCGTPSCMGILFKTMNEKNLQSEAFRFMPYLAFIKEPTPEVIRLLMGIHQQTKEPSVLLLLSSLIYRMCQHREDECDETGIIGKVVEDSEFYLLRLLGNDCQTDDLEKQQNIFYSLRGIGNMGRPSKAVPLLLDCMKHAKHTNISVAAIQAFRRMKLATNTKNIFYEVLTDKSEELEKRVEIFLLMMKAPTKTDIILATDLANDEQESSQMRSFINSYLRSVVKNKDPTKRRLSSLFQETLKEYPLSVYDPSPAKYSKAFLHSANLYKHAATVDGMVLFHPESFVPRTVNLNVTTQMFGFSINPLEINARIEGLEMLLGKYFASNGYLSGSYLKKIFEIPDKKLSRKRRSADESDEYKEIDDKVNMKKSSPQALLSMKVFGNEIQMITLDDIPFLNGKLDNMNIIKELYDLTKGKQKTFKRNIIVLEVSHSVPTILGLPLKIGVNSSAVVTTDVKGKVVTKNLLFGPKSVIMHGSLKPSISIHASGKLSVECVGAGEIGTAFQANMHAARKMHGRLEYNEGKELKVDLNADKRITDIFNVSYDIFHMTSERKEAVAAVAKLSQGYFCTDDFFNSSILFGSNTCLDISFPNAYYNLSSPYFPLTGPLHVGLRNYPTDASLKNYHLSIKKDNGLYAISVSTPGASSERKYIMRLGVTKHDDKGVIGMTFGEKKIGVVLNYNFNKETNEIDATLKSNITKMPITLFGKFCNETNPSTLNRNIGGSFMFSFGKYYMKHTLFYKNTYEYWALGSNLEYGPGKVANLDVKIQYEPQFFYLDFTHAPTNTKISASASPSLPVLEGRINITHGEDVDVRTFGRIDISSYEVIGDVYFLPGNQQVSANGKWIPKEKRVFLNGNINGGKVLWNASLKREKGTNVLSNTLNILNNTLNNVVHWSPNNVHATLSFNEKISTFDADFNRSNSHVDVDVSVNVNNQKSNIKFEMKNTSSLHKFCINGNFLDITTMGYCLNVYHDAMKTGIGLNVLTPEGDWISPLDFTRITNGSGSLLTAKFMEYMKVTYGESLNKLTLKFDGFGTMLEATKSKDDFDASELKLTSRNATGNVVLDCHEGYYKSLVMKGNHLYKLKFLYGDIKYWMEIHFKNAGIIVKLLDKNGVTDYSVVVRYDTKMISPPAKNVIYLDWDAQVGKIVNVESTVDRIGWLKFNEIIESGVRKLIMSGRPSAVTDSSNEKLVVASIDNNGNLKYKLLLNNPMLKGLVSMLQSNYDQTISNVEQIVSGGLQKVFGDLIKLEPKKVQNLISFFTKGVKEYLMTLKCNGETIQKEYINKKLDKKTITNILLKLLQLPLLPEFHALYQNGTNFNISDQFTNKASEIFETKNLLSLLHKIIANQVKTVLPSVHSKVFPGKPIKVEKMTIFEKEFLIYIQRIINLIQKGYQNSLQTVHAKHGIAKVTKYIPTKYKNVFVSVIENAVRILRTWRYNVKVSPSDNIQDLVKKFDQRKIDQLLQVDYFNVVANSVLSQSNFPDLVDRAFKMFLEDSNYVNLITRLSRFALQTYRVTGSHQKHIQQLLNSQSMPAYFKTLATLISKRGRLGPARTKPFKEYLKTRDMKTLFTEFKSLLKEKHQVSDTGVAALQTLLLHEDLKALSINGIPSLYEINFIPGILKKFVLNMKEESGFEILLKLINIGNPNMTAFIDEFKTIILSENYLNDSLAAMYKLILKTAKQHTSIDANQYLRTLEALAPKFLEISLNNDRDKKNAAMKLKKMTLQYFDSVVLQFQRQIPNQFTKRFSNVFNKIRKQITKLSAEKLQLNGTDEFVKVFTAVYDDLSKAIPTEIAAFVQTDMIETIKQLCSKIQINNETALSVYTRTWKKHNEYMMFLIRLLGQFSQSENPFADQFVRDGKILYYKIYQSIWKNKLASQENIEQISKLFNGLERRAFEEISKFTGNYSIVATMNNVFNYVKLLNYSDINAVVESYKSVHVTGFQNLTYSALQHHIRTLLEDIGAMKHGDTSVNQIVHQSLPDFAALTKKFFSVYNSSYYGYVYQIDMQEKYIKKAFEVAKQYLKQAQNEENKFSSFMLDLLVPGIDGLFLLAQKSGKSNDEAFLTSSSNRCTQIFLLQQQAATTAVDNMDEELSKMLEQYLNSSQCDVVKFFDDVQKIKKDKYFVENVLQKMESIVMKAYAEQKRDASIYLKMAKVILTGTKQFITENPENALQKIIFSMASKITSTAEKMAMYKQIRRVIRRSISLEDFDIKMIVKKYITQQLKKAAPSMSVERVNKLGRYYITFAVRSLKTNAQNVSLIILNGIDNVKAPLSKFDIVTDPAGYMKSLPKMLMDLLKENLKKNKAEIMSNLYQAETELRNLHLKFQQVLEKHSNLPKELLSKIKSSFKNATSPYFHVILNHIEKYHGQVDDKIKTLGLVGKKSDRLKQKLNILTRKTIMLRKQYNEIQKKFVQDLKKNITLLLNNDKLRNIDGKIFQLDAMDLRLKELNQAMNYMGSNLEQIMSKALYPQLRILISSIDRMVCDMKKNISKFYTRENDVHTLFWRMPELNEAMKQHDMLMKNVVVTMKNYSVLMQKMIEEYGILMDFDFVKTQSDKYINHYVSQILHQMVNWTKGRAENIHANEKMFQYYAAQKPDDVVQQGLTKYQDHIKKVALQVNEVIRIVPPTGFEIPIIKFLGLQYKEPKYIFQPISRTAYIFQDSLVTFDGKAVFLPKDLHIKLRKCKYLLSRDFMWKRFTIYLQNGNFVVELEDGKVVVERYHNNKVHVYTKLPPANKFVHSKEMPAQMIYTTVSKLPNMLKIENVFGLLIYCRLDVFACNVTVSGYLHNKTLGLFGTNNVESSDDLRMPDGKFAKNLLDFLNAYELTNDWSECTIEDAEDVFGDDEEELKREKKLDECTTLMNSISSDPKFTDISIRSNAFMSVCSVEKTCPTTSAFANSMSMEGEFVSTPPQCEACQEQAIKMRFKETSQPKIRITLLIKLTPQMKSILVNIKRVLRMMKSELGRKHDIEYNIVGFGGSRVRLQPHIQTGAGKVFMNADAALNALNYLQFTGNETEERLGFAALKFASLLEVTRSMRLFVLFDDDASYTNSLQQMIDVYAVMNERSIVLNTVNNYAFKRNVVGKDSFGLRYHVRVARGESFDLIRFPPPDDYIPLVKQTRGAVFALKAFKSKKSSWRKALPIAISKAISLQIEREANTCKECKCDICKNTVKEMCDYDL